MSLGGEPRWRILYLLLLIIVVVGGYSLGADSNKNRASILDNEINLMEEELKTVEHPDNGGSHSAGEINCLLCHALEQTKSFHVPEQIMKIDEKKGLRRRICIDCHGPSAYDDKGFLGWNANEQMTPLSLISFDEETGVNGLYSFSNIVPHSIHERLLKIFSVIDCQDCHPMIDSEIQVPEADTQRGHVLVCQNCKYHPENGNYIRIHVEDGGAGCPTCHTENAVEIHKEGTFNLGKVF